MARFWFALSLVWITVSFSHAAKLVDPGKCANGCKLDEDCVLYSECKLLDVKDSCGFCVCREGYRVQGSRCVEIKGYSTSTASTTTTTTTEATTTQPITESSTTASPDTTVTTTETTTTSTLPTTTGTTTQGPPPANPDPVSCQDYACTVGPPPPSGGDEANPLVVRSQLVNASGTDSGCKRQLVVPPRPCNLQGGGACYGIYCLTVSQGNDYCICPYYKTDRQCAVDKPGSCESATGTVPSNYTLLQDRRLRNPSNKDSGSIYGRHFAASITDCIKLCQWSQGSCRSVNYGTISGAKVCEMLSTAATEKNLLSKWLEAAPGWQYAQVGQAIA